MFVNGSLICYEYSSFYFFLNYIYIYIYLYYNNQSQAKVAVPNCQSPKQTFQNWFHFPLFIIHRYSSDYQLHWLIDWSITSQSLNRFFSFLIGSLSLSQSHYLDLDRRVMEVQPNPTVDNASIPQPHHRHATAASPKQAANSPIPVNTSEVYSFFP